MTHDIIFIFYFRLNMFRSASPNETQQVIKRVKSLAEPGTNAKIFKTRWRRLCSHKDCEKQAQRRGLCARHLTEEKKRQQSTASITVSRQSSTQPTTEELGPNSRHRTDLPDLIENHAGQTAVYSSGESFFSISWM
jgi:hypothetical protein